MIFLSTAKLASKRHVQITQSLNLKTHSQFEVIGSCLVEGFGEIWRIVERATCTGGVTVFTIPERVIGVESVLCSIILIPRIHIPRLTEVIFSNKCKCPDVLSR
ncbi:hypothetical protein GBAR_LOCUS25329, partial [Geodia barretti]